MRGKGSALGREESWENSVREHSHLISGPSSHPWSWLLGDALLGSAVLGEIIPTLGTAAALAAPARCSLTLEWEADLRKECTDNYFLL